MIEYDLNFLFILLNALVNCMVEQELLLQVLRFFDFFEKVTIVFGFKQQIVLRHELCLLNAVNLNLVELSSRVVLKNVTGT